MLHEINIKEVFQDDISALSHRLMDIYKTSRSKPRTYRKLIYTRSKLNILLALLPTN